MARGPFHLTICPGAWSAPSQWLAVQDSLLRYPTHLSGVTCADWPSDDAAAGLEAHAEAVLSAVPDEAEQVILLAHSFGAYPALEAAAQVSDRVKGLAFLDAFLPSEGQSVLDHSAGRRGADLMRADALNGLLPPPDPGIWNLDATGAEAIKPHLRPQALLSFEQGLSAAGRQAMDQVSHKAFLNAGGHDNSPFRQAFDQLEGRADWFALQIDGGHMLNVERPAAVAYWVAQFLSMAAGKGF